MIKPMGDRILVKKLESETKTKSGIILNDSSTEQEIYKAVVIEVSGDVSEIEKNEIVYFSKYKGENIKYNEEEYIILQLKDVLAKEIR